MQYEIVFTRQAHSDLELAFAWYENERTGLGWEFRNEIALCIDKLADERVSYPVYFGAVRKLHVARFPYLLYYKKYPRKKIIAVAAVLHERRNPDEIRKRMKR